MSVAVVVMVVAVLPLIVWVGCPPMVEVVAAASKCKLAAVVLLPSVTFRVPLP